MAIYIYMNPLWFLKYIITLFNVFKIFYYYFKLYQFVLFIKSGLRGWGCLHRHAYISQSKCLHLEGILWMIWTFVLKCWHLLLTLFGMVCALTLSPLHIVDIGNCLNRRLYVNCVRFDGYTQLSIVSTCIPMHFAKVQGIMPVLEWKQYWTMLLKCLKCYFC